MYSDGFLPLVVMYPSPVRPASRVAAGPEADAEPAEDDPRCAQPVAGDPQRALRIVDGGVNAQRHHQGVGTERAGVVDELLDGGEPSVVAGARGQGDVAVGS